MPTGPSWLFVAVRLEGRDANYINEQLQSKTLGTAQAKFNGRRIVDGIRSILSSVGAGSVGGNLWVAITGNSGSSGAFPTGAIVCTQANAAGDTLTFTYGGQTVVLTEGATGVAGFARGASNTTMATALAAAINAHPVLGGIVGAVPAAGTVTLTAKIPGQFMQDYALSTNDATAFGLTQLAGGAEFTAVLMPQSIHTGRTP